MAKFRRNHAKSDRASRTTIRAFLYAVIFIGLFVIGLYKIADLFDDSFVDPEELFGPDAFENFSYLPSGSEALVLHHDYFALGYNENTEQADWVVYKLTKASLEVPNVERTDYFSSDTIIASGSAHYKDYSRTGYTRGHLVPAGDMAFSNKAMEQSFLMSNISPQLENFNGGIWRELEENVRNWAWENDELYIMSGPMFNGSSPNSIGRNEVRVPDAFYKAILDVRGPEQKSLAFMIPHEVTEKPLSEFMLTIDSLESLLALDIFPDLYVDTIEENRLESKLQPQKWPLDPEIYLKRIREWNKR